MVCRGLGRETNTFEWALAAGYQAGIELQVTEEAGKTGREFQLDKINLALAFFLDLACVW
jgi:hypothetical protein